MDVHEDDYELSSNVSDNVIISEENRYKKGIIYLSSIPKYMNVTQLRELMQEFGEVGRIYLQPAKTKNKKNKPAKHFTEGWVEFKKKRIAKEVGSKLNNKQIGGKKKSKYYDFIWNIKYLSRFKWVHLSERLAYEKAVHKHRMRAEIAQVKKEATNFSLRLDRSVKLKSLPPEQQKPRTNKPPQQHKTEDEIINNKNRKKENQIEENDHDRSVFLEALFA